MLYLILHITVGIVICIISIIKDNIEAGIINLIISFFIPLFGPLFVIIAWIYDKNKAAPDERIEDYLHYIREETEVKLIRSVDVESEINVVPVEEALIVNKDSVKRKLVIDVLKEDANRYISILKRTLRDDDTETSHYAAAAIAELNRKFSLLIQDALDKYKKDNNSLDNIKRYADVLRKYLRSGLLDSNTKEKYINIYRKILEDLLNLDKSDKYNYIDKINYELDAHDYMNAKKYCTEFFNTHKHDEDAYLLFIKLFYMMKDKINMLNMINTMKQCPLTLSEKSLDIIEFWERSMSDKVTADKSV
jgi:hypothetical protein